MRQEQKPSQGGDVIPGQSSGDAQQPVIDNNTDKIADESGFSGEGEALFSAENLHQYTLDIVNWFKADVMTVEVLLQVGILVGAIVPAALFAPRLKTLIRERLVPLLPLPALKRAASALAEIATPISLFLILQIARTALAASGFGTVLIEAGISLLSAWIIIRMVTLVIRSAFWSKVAFYVAWPIAALDAFGVLGNVFNELEKISFPLGENDVGQTIRFSALDALRVMVVFGFLFWVANLVKGFLANRIRSVDELTPSIKTLLIKIIDILMPIIALLIALQVVGFNLATLTIFGGAIGLGVGLGLQKTISNFIAGFTLVADKSIKPGDIIEVGDTFGWVTQMGTRYVTVRTRDATEHLVPNDQFIEDGVVNWSHCDKVVRLHAKIGVSYNTEDLRKVKELCEGVALGTERVLKTPAPNCNLMEFGDSSINFDLRFWINDPAKGVSNVRSDVMLGIWDTLKANNIEIPFPQRDLHIKSLPSGIGQSQWNRAEMVDREGE